MALTKIKHQPLQRQRRGNAFQRRIHVASPNQRNLDRRGRLLDAANHIGAENRQQRGFRHPDRKRCLTRLFPGIARDRIAALRQINQLREIIGGPGVDSNRTCNQRQFGIGRHTEILPLGQGL